MKAFMFWAKWKVEKLFHNSHVPAITVFIQLFHFSPNFPKKHAHMYICTQILVLNTRIHKEKTSENRKGERFDL